MSGVAILAFSKNKKLYQHDASFIYRCMNLASGLEKKKRLNFIGHFKNYEVNKNTKYILLHRPIYSLSLAFFIRKMKKKGVKIIADVDDLIIHPDFSEYSPAVVNNILTKKQVSQKFLKNYKALKLCDHIVCSTEQLGDYLKQYFINTPITVLHNCVFYDWNEGVVTQNDSPNKKISYFSGTKSHDYDFALIKKPLEAFLGDNPNVHLDIVGPLESSLNAPNGQVSFLNKVSFYDYEELVKESNINLAPLEDSIFNHCKSALKAIEAGSFGIPTIFSPNDDAKRFDSVLIAETEDDWYKYLTILCDDKNKKFDHLSCYKNIVSQADVGLMTDKFCAEVLGYSDV